MPWQQVSPDFYGVSTKLVLGTSRPALANLALQNSQASDYAWWKEEANIYLEWVTKVSRAMYQLPKLLPQLVHRNPSSVPWRHRETCPRSRQSSLPEGAWLLSQPILYRFPRFIKHWAYKRTRPSSVLLVSYEWEVVIWERLVHRGMFYFSPFKQLFWLFDSGNDCACLQHLSSQYHFDDVQSATASVTENRLRLNPLFRGGTPLWIGLDLDLARPGTWWWPSSKWTELQWHSLCDHQEHSPVRLSQPSQAVRIRFDIPIRAVLISVFL